MKLVITLDGTETILNVDISDDMNLQDFKAYLEAETDIAPEYQLLYFNSKELTSRESTLADLGLSDNDLLVLKQNSPQVPLNTSTTVPSDDQIEQQRQALLSDPRILGAIGNPQLSSILNNAELFKEFFKAQASSQSMNGYGMGLGTEPLYDREIARLRSLPDTADNRKQIQELEDLQAVEENRLLAYEMSPELFTQVPMLYIKMEVNNVPVTLFVDTGAQMTIMTPKLAEKCGLKKLIDKRFRGEARGVGSGQILGKIHSAPVKIEDAYIPCSFVILDSGVDLILGLDMLRRHQANVNLKENKLQISDVQTPFLSEAESRDTFFSSMGAGVPLEAGSSAKKPKLANLASAAATAAATRASGSSSAAAAPAVDESKVDQLVALGFGRDQAKTALQQCNGNVDMAASLLFQ